VGRGEQALLSAAGTRPGLASGLWTDAPPDLSTGSADAAVDGSTRSTPVLDR
jgi:hypothetical protein